jgi:putative redox protein
MALEIEVTHGGGKKIDAKVGRFVVHTDQSKLSGGDGTAPEPYTLFLSSLATCAGIYVVGFCQARDIPTQDIRLIQDHDFDESTGKLKGVRLTVELPSGFPEKYRDSVVRAAAACTVKKTIENPPPMTIEASVR